MLFRSGPTAASAEVETAAEVRETSSPVDSRSFYASILTLRFTRSEGKMKLSKEMK